MSISILKSKRKYSVVICYGIFVYGIDTISCYIFHHNVQLLSVIRYDRAYFTCLSSFIKSFGFCLFNGCYYNGVLYRAGLFSTTFLHNQNASSN